MNLEFFIAKRIIWSKENKRSASQSIINITIAGIALSLAVMILSVAIVTGFKKEIKNKVAGFGAHIIITNHDTNISYETTPVSKSQPFYPSLAQHEGIKHIQVFGMKAGIIKTDTDIEGVVLKGVGSDFDWSFFDTHIVEGETFRVNDEEKTNDVVISHSIAQRMQLELNDDLIIYFIQKEPRVRKFRISGIYDTNLEEYDKLFILVDIGHIQKLNYWSENQVSGFEVLIDDFDNLPAMYNLVQNEAGFLFTDDGSKLQVKSIEENNPAIFNWLELTNTNEQVILILMVIVAGFNMISGLLILILERTTMVGILKAMGMHNWTIRKIFLYNAAFLTGKGLLWGNLIGIGVAIIQWQFGVIKLDPASYYMPTVPINLQLWHILLLNAGTLLIVILMLILPSMLITKIKPLKAIRFN